MSIAPSRWAACVRYRTHQEGQGIKRMNHRFQSYIDGQWIAGADIAADENPSDLGTPVGEYGAVDAAQVRDAIAAAAAAQSAWALTSPQQRADALDFVGSEILARKEELGRLLALEEGKTL